MTKNDLEMFIKSFRDYILKEFSICEIRLGSGKSFNSYINIVTNLMLDYLEVYNGEKK